jgi:hypothetical protein
MLASGRLCERSDESSGSIKAGNFLNQLSNYQFFFMKTLYHGVTTWPVWWVSIPGGLMEWLQLQ